MGKYRLKSRQAGSVITLMEIDTESRAWYIKADHKEAALKALKDMGPALACVETIYINGDDVSGMVFAPAPMMIRICRRWISRRRKNPWRATALRRIFLSSRLLTTSPRRRKRK